MGDMKRCVISTFEDRIDRRGKDLFIGFPEELGRGQFETFVKVEEIIWLKKMGGIITFFHEIHNTYSFTLLSFDGDNVGFMCVAPNR